MSDRVTLLLLVWVYRPIARAMAWPRRALAWMDWLEDRYERNDTEVLFWDVFKAPSCAFESRPQLWIDHWLCRACQLEQAAKTRLSADKPNSGL